MGEKDQGDTPKEGLYPGDYLVPVGKALAEEFGAKLLDMPQEEALGIAKDRAIDAMMALIRDDPRRHRPCAMTCFFSERNAGMPTGASAIRKAINDLTNEGACLQGQAAAAQGPGSRRLGGIREQNAVPLHRGRRRHGSSAGQVGRCLHLFFAADVGYMKDKIAAWFRAAYLHPGRRFTAANVQAHGGAGARRFRTATSRLTILLCQMVKLFRAGEPVRMSKRAGTFVTAARRGRRGRP